MIIVAGHIDVSAAAAAQLHRTAKATWKLRFGLAIFAFCGLPVVLLLGFVIASYVCWHDIRHDRRPSKLAAIYLKVLAALTTIGVGIYLVYGVFSRRGPFLWIGLVFTVYMAWRAWTRTDNLLHRRWDSLMGAGGILCRACSYDLTGNLSGTCPECGEKISFRADG